MPIGYKYAEREADSQINWAEVGRGFRDVLEETNRVREEKKAALDEAQRETMNYLAETPNGEHVGARQSIVDYANIASNQMRIVNNLLKAGIMDPKDYTIYRQNLTDNTNLAFNANKMFQERWSDVMQGVRDKKYSQLYADNFEEVQAFGNWKNIGWQIAPNGVVMAGKMTEQIIDGKKVRTLDKSPESLRSMDYLNQAIVSQIDFYNYEDKINEWAKTLGEEKILTGIDLGGIERKGILRTKEDITSREDILPGQKKALVTFIEAENNQIASIVGNPLDAARVLVDSAIFAPNKKQYRTTTSEKDAKENPEAILKVVDPDSGGFKYIISPQQQEEVNEFVRSQMRVKYNYKENAEVVGATARDEKRPPSQTEIDLDKEREAARVYAENLKNFIVGDPEVSSNATKALQAYLDKYGEGALKGSKLLRGQRGIEIVNSDGNKKRFEYSANGKEIDPLTYAKTIMGTFNSEGISEDLIAEELEKLFKGSTKGIDKTKAQGYQRNVKDEVSKKISEEVGYADFLDNSSDETAAKIEKLFKTYNELKPESKITVDYESGAGDDIYIYQSGKLIKTLNSDWDGDITQAKKQYSELQSLIQKLNADAFLGTAQKGTKPKTVNTKGKGSKW